MNKGDRVKVINYGHLLWITKEKENPFHKLIFKYPIISKNKDFYVLDTRPEFINKRAVIEEVIDTNSISKYGLRFEDGSYTSWFTSDQLILLKDE